MRVLSMVAVAAAMIANSSGAFAGELPSYEVTPFPISATQVQVLGGAGVEEQSTAPAMIVAGMPASPADVGAVATREAACERQREQRGALSLDAITGSTLRVARDDVSLYVMLPGMKQRTRGWPSI